MKVRIYRTTGYRPKEAPVEGAYAEIVDRTPNNPGVAIWREWFLDIETLEDLAELHKKVEHELVFFVNDGQPTIEIYDNYRE